MLTKEFYLIINFCRKLGGNGGTGPVKRFSTSFACAYKMSGKITHPKIRYGVKSNVVFQKIKKHTAKNWYFQHWSIAWWGKITELPPRNQRVMLDEVAKCFKLLRWNTFYSPFNECPGQCQLTPGHLLGVKKNGFSYSENWSISLYHLFKQWLWQYIF